MEASTEGGVHIHAGRSCEGAEGHYLYSDGTDPWGNATYSSDADGIASIDVRIEGTNADRFSLAGDIPFSRDHRVVGHALVIHAGNGDRIGCGLIELDDASRTSNESSRAVRAVPLAVALLVTIFLSAIVCRVLRHFRGPPIGSEELRADNDDDGDVELPAARFLRERELTHLVVGHSRDRSGSDIV